MKKDRERYIRKLFIADLKTLAEIGKELKITSTRVRQLLDRTTPIEQMKKIKVIRSAVKKYEANKKREERYKEDKPYREKIIKRAKKRYNKLKANI